MSDWICPACGGGFPDDRLVNGSACPWCRKDFKNQGSSSGNAECDIETDDQTAALLTLAAAFYQYNLPDDWGRISGRDEAIDMVHDIQARIRSGEDGL
ncbi:hypothetical protein [Haloterrigena salifodinae]|uniref:hypothetical protein n=1 Tax=Haloterrigena salifodinae TaxID=2675099 RepID=UPI000F882B71|nr:hypothetical protein [Haloterrigena salifodinae]